MIRHDKNDATELFAAANGSGESMLKRQLNQAFNMAADAAILHDAIAARFWWVIERMKDVPPVQVYPCQAESGSGYFTVDTRGQKFSGASVEEAIDAAMR